MTTTFGRVTRIEVDNDVRMSMKDLDIEFEVEFDDDTNPNESIIKVFNLSKSTLSKINRNDKVGIVAGYETDGSGYILNSRVSSIRSEWEGVDRVTRITVIDGPDLSNKKTKKKTYGKNVKASQILKDLVPLLGVPTGKINLPKDVSYPKGYTVNEKVVEEVEKLAKACGAAFFIHKQRLYICRIADAASSTRFTLSSDTGLIGSPEPYENDGERGYKVKCLLQYRISTASLITIKSKTANGQFRVRRGRHIKNGSDFITEIEVVKA
ncbi:phage protein [Exiguobacterium aestuarii]|uniref:phage protein n=1 Tax=Exiguobacterium aestuarii TaxID=273527 RepID=UPI001CD34BC9|nr:hypothetical protein [Exiguobacterium aestuarii]MCA0980244.1 hypothetical protein [Exiguobacterium aestuarii]